MMRDTVICSLAGDADRDAITASIEAMVAEVAAYVPGYRLRVPPQFAADGSARVGLPRGRGRAATSCRRTPATSTS